jgi:hypothetical protein
MLNYDQPINQTKPEPRQGETRQAIALVVFYVLDLI